MPKNTKIVSFSLPPDLHKVLKKEASKRGKNLSELIRFILSKFPIYKEDVQLIVLQIPKDIIGDKDQLQDFLAKKCEFLLDKLV